MTSILEGLRGLVTPAVVHGVSAQTGESEAAVAKGLSALVPTFLSSIADHSEDAGFMKQVANLATGVAGDSAASLAGFEKGATLPMASSSAISGWLPNLFGGGLSSVTDTVARYAGIRPTSASSMMTLAAPIVLGYLGRLMSSNHLDAAGLGRKLRDERRSFTSALPLGFDAALPGVARPLAAMGSAGAQSRTVPVVSGYDTDSRVPWKLLLMLAALAVVGLLWATTRTRTDIPAGVDQAVSSGLRTASSAVASLTRSLPGNVDIQVLRGSLEDRLSGYLASPGSASSGEFAFDRIGFETGSASLTPASRSQLASVATILKAYPSARVSIEGYTDNVGDASANVSLSTERANAVMAALRGESVSNAIDARGFGSDGAVADNSTEAGRAQNRRVVLRVASGRP